MHLPGRLRSTTLGDLLGALHRSGASGTLELTEDRGRTHRIHLTQGLVTAVELDGAGLSLAEILRRERVADEDVLRRSLLRAISSRRLHGEVLVSEFHVSPAIVGGALRRQIDARLGAIEELSDARVAFRVAVRQPRWALHAFPLDAREFLHGRRRARERGSPRWEGDGAPSPPVAAPSAWRVLGLPPGTEVAEIKRAYRRLARTVHPDLHPEATEDQRRALEARFVVITEAYRALVA
ncbi:MAG TPA: J domain-containing protein [Polyangiaceae bacterium]|nr:J domain-containing protein [Polyangiaceae bacterium]